MFSASTLVLLKRFITPTTIMLLVIAVLLGTVWYKNKVIQVMEVDVSNKKEKIVWLTSVNKNNQNSISSMKLTNGNMAEHIMEQNRRIERLYLEYDMALEEHNSKVNAINKKYDNEIKRILGSVPPKVENFDCKKDVNKAIDAIQAMEFLFQEEQK